jgi:uncharacterized membrane protein
MEEWLIHITEIVIHIIEAMALFVIAFGVIESFVGMLRTIAHHDKRRVVWLQLARWLVAGLTLQLAADILETSISQDWIDLGQLAAIAVIRTFLSYFLERDMTEVRELEAEASEKSSE